MERRLLDPYPVDEVVQGLADHRSEEAVEVKSGEAGDLRQFLQREDAVEVGLDVVDDSVNPRGVLVPKVAAAAHRASTSVPASSTPVIAVAAATQTPAGLSRTATVAALLTQAATKQQGQPVQPTATLRPTNTPTKALAQVATATSTRSVTGALTAVPTATQSAPTATATQATGGSGGQLSATQTALPTATLAATPTALPQTGLADQAGIPGMFGIALALIVVIFLARRLRTA